MVDSKELYAEADRIQMLADAKRKEANARRLEEGRSRDLADRLCYAAYTRCKCGLGMAYDPFQQDRPGGVFYGPDAWECSGIILKTADPNVLHSAALPFAFYEIKSEDQPSAQGATTRPKSE